MFQRLRPVSSQAAILTLIFAAGITSNAAAQDKQAPDPWFTENRDVTLEDLAENSLKETDEDTKVSLRAKNPKALVRSLKESLASVSQFDLTKQISILEEIVATIPDKTDEERAALQTLKQKKQAILESIQTVAKGDLSIEDSIAQLGPHANYFKGDSALLVQLLRSPITQRIDSRVRVLSRTENYDGIQELRGVIVANGLESVLGTRLKDAATSSLSDTIANRWQELSNGAALLPGEAYLLGRLLGKNNMKLRLGVSTPESIDDRLESQIARSIESAWGESLEVVPSDQRSIRQNDLVLAIDANQIDSQLFEKTNTVSSTIPGMIVEEPNPVFLELVAKYEKAAKSYQTAMKSYEMQYELYLRQFEDQEYNQAQQQRDLAQEHLNATPSVYANGDVNPDYFAARENLQLAESLANSLSPSSMPEPAKPLPTHLNVLEELQLEPSTIITSEEQTPYEYVVKDLEYEFKTMASLKLLSPATQTESDPENVSLKQIRTWTKSEGANPRDPAAQEGTFNRDAFNSALDLFCLEFGTRCAKSLALLMRDTSNRLNATDPESDGLSGAVLYLALANATSERTTRPLSQTELSGLAQLASANGTTLKDLRAAYLKMILQDSPFSEVASEQTLSQLL